MKTLTLNVPEVSCGHCKSSIEGAVGALPGIDRVEVDIEAKSVDVAYDETALGFDAIVTAIEDQGYAVAR